MRKVNWSIPAKGHKDKRKKRHKSGRMVISRFEDALFRIVKAAAAAKSQSMSYTIYEAVKEKYQPESAK